MITPSLLLLAPALLLTSRCAVAASDSVTSEAPDIGFYDDKSADNADDASLKDYIIVGAGGSGLQMALFLQKYNLSYTVLEKEDTVGSFWARFPVFDELISVNKRTKNETQQLRYDWHSMLDAPLQMQNITRSYFPNGKDWLRYMERVAEMARLNIEFGVHVESIASDGSPCVVLSGGSKRCAGRRVFIGTGLKEKSEHLLEALGGIPYSRVTREMAVDRRVCILGNGNSGFEVAKNVYDVADRVIIMGKEPFRLSSVTRYTGDVRVKFLQPVENFHGKLLDTVIHFLGQDFPYLQYVQTLEPDKDLNASQLKHVSVASKVITFLAQYNCEMLVLATGFRSHIPGKNLQSRFPQTKSRLYQDEENENVHYIGWLMHEADFRRGAGGFLSGYRYLIRNLVHHIREEDFGVAYPYLELATRDAVASHVVARVQIAHDLIILQDGVVIRDVIVPVGDIFHYYEGITFDFHDIMSEHENAISLYFAWGDGRSSNHVFDSIYWYKDTLELINLFLHPVIETRGLTRHIVEDLDMEWRLPNLVSGVDRVIRDALDGNLSKFEPRKFYAYEQPTINRTNDTQSYEIHPHPLDIPLDILRAIWVATYYNFENDRAMETLRAAARNFLPALHEVKDDECNFDHVDT